MRTRGKAKKDGVQFKKGEGGLFSQMERMQQGLEQGVPESHYFTQRQETESEESEGEPEEPPVVLQEREDDSSVSSSESEAFRRGVEMTQWAQAVWAAASPSKESTPPTVNHVASPPADQIKLNFAKDHSAEAVLEGRRQSARAKERAGIPSEVKVTTDSPQDMLDCLNEENAIDAAQEVINRAAQESHGKAYGEPTEPIGHFKVPPKKVYVNPYQATKKKDPPPPAKKRGRPKKDDSAPPPPPKKTNSAPKKTSTAPKKTNRNTVIPAKGNKTRGPNSETHAHFQKVPPHTVENVAQAPPNVPNNSAESLVQLMNSTHAADSLEGQEKAVVAQCKRGANQARTEQRKEASFTRLITTLEEIGKTETWVHQLLEQVNCQYLKAKGDFTTTDYALFDILGGQRTPAKRQIVGRLLIIMGTKWKKEVGNYGGAVGDPLQPNAHMKIIRNVMGYLRLHGIQYSHDEFTGPGEFAGIMADMWKYQREAAINKENGKKGNTKFGTMPNKKRAPVDFPMLILAAIASKVICPEDPDHLLKLIVFCMGYYCGLRGGEEHAMLMMADVGVGYFTSADAPTPAHVGLRYVWVDVHFSKTEQLGVHKTSVSSTQRTRMIIPTEIKVAGWTPTDWIIDDYLAHVHPDANRFYCKYIQSASKRVAINKELKSRDIEWNLKNPHNPRPIKEYDIRYWHSGNGVSNHNIGQGGIREHCKDLARICGVADFNACTGQALRALGQTTCIQSNLNGADTADYARHNNINSHMAYAQDCSERKSNQLNALSIANVQERHNARMGISTEVEVAEEAPRQDLLPPSRERSMVVLPGAETEREKILRLQYELETARLQLELERARSVANHGANRPNGWHQPHPQNNHPFGYQGQGFQQRPQFGDRFNGGYQQGGYPQPGPNHGGGGYNGGPPSGQYHGGGGYYPGGPEDFRHGGGRSW